MKDGELQSITVSVPADRVPEFYEMFAKWLRAVRSAEAPATAGGQAPTPFAKASLEQRMTWWNQLADPAIRIYLFAAANPGQRYDGTELANACKIAKGPQGVAGTLSWPGRHAGSLNIESPLGWDREQQKYWMSGDAAVAVLEAERASRSAGSAAGRP